MSLIICVTNLVPRQTCRRHVPTGLFDVRTEIGFDGVPVVVGPDVGFDGDAGLALVVENLDEDFARFFGIAEEDELYVGRHRRNLPITPALVEVLRFLNNGVAAFEVHECGERHHVAVMAETEGSRRILHRYRLISGIDYVVEEIRRILKMHAVGRCIVGMLTIEDGIEALPEVKQFIGCEILPSVFCASEASQ